MFVDEKLRNNDPDIRNAIINTEKYLIKYVDEYGELIEQYKNEIPSLGIILLLITLFILKILWFSSFLYHLPFCHVITGIVR